jgi:hypothetical protein
MLKKEEIILRCRSTSPPYYQEEHEDEKLEKITQNFELEIHYVLEQKVATKGIKTSRGVHMIFITR